jgi:DeoR family transcriptional regulator, glycerol-3-phosphate regulon repressor
VDELSSRQKEILGLAQEVGRVNVEDLASRFDVSPQTIRKDLSDLCDRRLLNRIHGGAVIASGVENVGYEARRFIAQEEKRLIGAAAAKLIPDDSSLFINIGTTTEEVARALSGRRGLLVITNNLNVATLLYPQLGIDVIVAGGTVRRSDGGVVGSPAVDFIKQFKMDYAVIGVSAIDQDGALLDFDYQEVKVSQAIIENARKVILVADRLKLERVAPVRIAHISQIDIFVTDKLPSAPLQRMCTELGVEVIEVTPQSDEPGALDS